MFRLEIATNNHAFAENPYQEIGRILTGLGERMLSEWVKNGVLRDISGASVGNWQYTDDTDNTDSREDWTFTPERGMHRVGGACGTPWVAEIEPCPNCGRPAAAHSKVAHPIPGIDVPEGD